MRSPRTSSLLWAVLGTGLAVHAVASPAAIAQQPAAGGSASTSSASTEVNPPGPPASPAPSYPPATPPDPTPPSGPPPTAGAGIPVEKLPGSAFPDVPGRGIFGGPWSLTRDPVRGIWGGSLWLGTFHGLQWPYIPRTGIGLSGSAWVDTGYEQIKRPDDGSHKDSKFWLQQGRAVLRVTPTYSDGSFFVQAQAELVGNKDQNVVQPQVADTDDLWVRVGHWHKWDLQVGRYESWELYHLGMGLDLNTLERIGAEDNRYSGLPAVGPYLVRFGDVRPSGVGNAALHLYPFSFLRLEMLGLVGNETQGLNSLGTRSSAILDLGIIKLKGGGEYSKSRGSENISVTMADPSDTNMMINVEVESRQTKFQRGYGGSVQLVLPPFIEAGVNAAQGLVDETAEMSGALQGKGSYTITSIGGFANGRLVENLVLGVGGNFTTKRDLDRQSATMRAGTFAHLQTFVALQYVVARQLFVKAVAGYSRADYEQSTTTTNFSNYMYSIRIRLMYLF